MSWLDFANHFLSNQWLHAWSWINRTFSGMVFFGGKFGSECFGFSLFLLLFSAGRESYKCTRFWLAIKGKGPLQVVVSFLSLYYVLFEYLFGPKTLLYNSLIFFRSLIEDFLFSFFFSSDLWLGTSFFLLFSSDIWSGTFFFLTLFSFHLNFDSFSIEMYGFMGLCVYIDPVHGLTQVVPLCI